MSGHTLPGGVPALAAARLVAPPQDWVPERLAMVASVAVAAQQHSRDVYASAQTFDVSGGCRGSLSPCRNRPSPRSAAIGCEEPGDVPR